jgi:hypothetical protein
LTWTSSVILGLFGFWQRKFPVPGDSASSARHQTHYLKETGRIAIINCFPNFTMWLSSASLVSVLAVFVLASAAPVADQPKIDYDAIVGGGPAGLAALSALARVRRNVLLVDSGVYRNGPTRHMHDVLGFDGK